MKNCDCDGWVDNIEELSRPFNMRLYPVGEYKGKQFDFCPWCGRELVLVPGTLAEQHDHDFVGAMLIMAMA